MPLSKAKVMLVDDHAMVRYGMVMLINREHDMEVFAEANDSEEALVILEQDSHPSFGIGGNKEGA